MTIFNIAVSKVNRVLVFDSAKLPESSIEYLLEYGLKQALGDSHASITSKTHPDSAEMVKAAAELVEKRESQIRTGSVPRSTQVVSPVLLAAAKAGVTEAQLLEMIAATAAKAAKKHAA